MVPQSGHGMLDETSTLFRIISTLLVSLFYSIDHFGTYKELIVSVVVEQTYTSNSDMTESIKSASIRHRSRWTKTPSARCVLSSRRFAAAHHCRRPSVDCTPVRLCKNSFVLFRKDAQQSCDTSSRPTQLNTQFRFQNKTVFTTPPTFLPAPIVHSTPSPIFSPALRNTLAMLLAENVSESMAML